MCSFLQQLTVTRSVPQDQTHFVLRKAIEQPLGSQQIVTMLFEQVINLMKTAFQGIEKLEWIGGTAIQFWLMVRGCNRPTLALEMHLIGPRAFPAGAAHRELLPRVGAEAA